MLSLHPGRPGGGRKAHRDRPRCLQGLGVFIQLMDKILHYEAPMKELLGLLLKEPQGSPKGFPTVDGQNPALL